MCVCSHIYWKCHGTTLTRVKRRVHLVFVCLHTLYACVYVIGYLREDQYSVPLLFQLPQHLLHQHQFPRGLCKG